MKPHPHAPWRSAFGDFKSPGRASAKPAAGRAAMPLEASSPLRVVAPSAQSRWPLQPLHLASSSHRDRSVSRSVPEASRERGVTPARRRRPSPSLWHTSGRPPRMGDGRGDCTGGFGSGDKLGGYPQTHRFLLLCAQKGAERRTSSRRKSHKAALPFRKTGSRRVVQMAVLQASEKRLSEYPVLACSFCCRRRYPRLSISDLLFQEGLNALRPRRGHDGPFCCGCA